MRRRDIFSGFFAVTMASFLTKVKAEQPVTRESEEIDIELYALLKFGKVTGIELFRKPVDG